MSKIAGICKKSHSFAMITRKRNTNLSRTGWASLLSIVALLCFQCYWLHDSYTTTYAKFVADVSEALQEACEQEKQWTTEKMLSLSVEERERPALYPEEILLNEWLPELIAPFQLRKDKEVEFQVTCSSDNIKIKIDKAHFANALNNIIDNALKYSGEQVKVVVACERMPHKLQISIRDNGFGIPGSDIQKIFDRFYRGKTTADRIKGFGLGLNYAKTIVEYHGGTIEARSVVGEGSNFIITLPAED
jgi:signal transduction histidine kinase